MSGCVGFSITENLQRIAGLLILACVLQGCGGNSKSIGFTGATLLSIGVTPASQTIPVGAGQQFKATGTYSDNSTQDLTASVIWNSSETAVATITSGGLATGAAPGMSTIVATLDAVSGNTTLNVAVTPALQTISVSPVDPTLVLQRTCSSWPPDPTVMAAFKT